MAPSLVIFDLGGTTYPRPRREPDEPPARSLCRMCNPTMCATEWFSAERVRAVIWAHVNIGTRQ